MKMSFETILVYIATNIVLFIL